MPSRRCLLAFGGVLLALFGVAMLHPYPRQSLFGPKIRGEPWCVWEDRVRRRCGEPRKSFFDKLERWLGVEQDRLSLEEMFDHPEMLPLMVALLEDRDPNVRYECTWEIAWTPCLRDSAALPALRRMQKDGSLEAVHRFTAAEGIWRIDKDEESLDWIVKQLDSGDPEIRERAMQSVAHLCNDAPELLPHVIAHARDPNLRVRYQVMNAMAHFGKKGMPVLIDGLQDPDPKVRGWAIEIVGQMGADALTAFPVLETLLTDADPAIASQALLALQRLAPERYQHLRAERKIE